MPLLETMATGDHKMSTHLYFNHLGFKKSLLRTQRKPRRLWKHICLRIEVSSLKVRHCFAHLLALFSPHDCFVMLDIILEFRLDGNFLGVN